VGRFALLTGKNSKKSKKGREVIRPVAPCSSSPSLTKTEGLVQVYPCNWCLRVCILVHHTCQSEGKLTHDLG
jgi:hypothetical protein